MGMNGKRRPTNVQAKGQDVPIATTLFAAITLEKPHMTPI